MYELSTTSADGVSIGEPRSERVQTDLDKRVTGEWNEQEVAVQSVSIEKFSVVVELLRLKVCHERKRKCVDVAVACPLRYFKDQT